MGSTLRQAQWPFIILYVLIGVLATWISSIKWYLLAKPQGIQVPFSRFIMLYLVGFFFNHFLPTSVGGDVVRGYELGKLSEKKPEAMASVFMERFTGVTVLMLFAVAAVILRWEFFQEARLMIVFFVVVTGYSVCVWMIFHRSFLSLIEKNIPGSFFKRIFKKIRHVQDAIYLYRQHWPCLGLALLCSVFFYLLAVFGVYVGCLTFAENPPLQDLLIAVPILLILFLIPISIGGIGYQEWAYLFVLSHIGVPITVGLSLGLLYRARSIAFGLLGGAIYPLVSGRKLQDVQV